MSTVSWGHSLKAMVTKKPSKISDMFETCNKYNDKLLVLLKPIRIILWWYGTR